MKKQHNMGGLDRLARLITGLALLTAALFTPLGAAWSVVAFFAGAVLTGTAVVGFCPGYVPFRIDTRRRGLGAL